MSTLCQKCKAFDIQSLNGTTFPWRGYRIQDIKASVDQGCTFCKMIAKAFPMIFVDWKRDEVYRVDNIDSFVHFRALTESDIEILQGRSTFKNNKKDISLPGTSTGGLNITRLYASIALNPLMFAPLSQWWEEGLLNGTTAEFHVVADRGDPAATSGDVAGRYIGRSSRSEHHYERIMNWLASCQEGHAECLQSLSGMEKLTQQDTPLPTRCIRVQMTDSGNVESCLVETTGLNGRYIILSHRWISDTADCSTTNQNVQERLNGGSLGTLPPLFTDAFTLAARLRIPYVWIDSLCIIQGDPQEWERESIKMANYYQRSLFTVACPPANSTTGLFNCMGQNPNLPLPVPLTRLPYRDSEGKQQGHFYLHPGDRDLLKLDWLSISKTELFTRGWVYQEAALSRRFACFTSTGLHLRCRNEYPKPHKNHLFEWETGPVTMGPGSVFELSYRRWYEVVESYSGLNLTDPDKDRLVALGGIAEEFSFALKSSNCSREYVAGLWRATLPESLLWHQTHQGSHRRIASIPTWSWASICTAVHWTSDPKRRSIQSQWSETNCSVVDILNPKFEQVNSGEIDTTSFVNGPIEIPGNDQITRGENPRNRFPILCVRGKMQPVILGGPFESEQDSRIAAEVTRHSLEYGMIGWRMIASPLDSGHVAGWASLEHPAFQDDEAEEQQSPEGALYALHISTFHGMKGGLALGYRGWGHAYHVVFIRPVSTIPDGFERVGVGRLYGREIDRGFKDAEERIIRLV